MKHKLFKKEGNHILNLFFAGWGMDEHPFLHLTETLSAGEDLCICFDYSDLQFDTSLLLSYGEIRIFAWSFGVWVASVVFPKELINHFNITKTVAINGTRWPIHDTCGINEAIFKGTLETLTPENLNRFNRRMCGNKEVLRFFEARRPQRSFEEIKMELHKLGKFAKETPLPLTLTWRVALIGENDLIFSPANQREAWKDTEIRTLAISHYAPWLPFETEDIHL